MKQHKLFQRTLSLIHVGLCCVGCIFSTMDVAMPNRRDELPHAKVKRSCRRGNGSGGGGGGGSPRKRMFSHVFTDTASSASRVNEIVEKYNWKSNSSMGFSPVNLIVSVIFVKLIDERTKQTNSILNGRRYTAHVNHADFLRVRDRGAYDIPTQGRDAGSKLRESWADVDDLENFIFGSSTVLAPNSDISLWTSLYRYLSRVIENLPSHRTQQRRLTRPENAIGIRVSSRDRLSYCDTSVGELAQTGGLPFVAGSEIKLRNLSEILNKIIGLDTQVSVMYLLNLVRPGQNAKYSIQFTTQNVTILHVGG
ncbi:hypothetical protein WN51_03507 [Melipona quadrifasciata]|uniref:Uncharacterized protein n=1 Tax=Melipona quadrifasciata TaxID=166423 RepID=A0A0M8ZWX3_9HYME|nr:hypothetical protein WN51_03507 [Melipona quadrifasciata]